MSDSVSRETQFSTRIAAQVEQRLAGRRKNVRHGGTLCSTCLMRPPRPDEGDCLVCHAQSQKDYRQRRKARLAAEKQNTSKGNDNEQHKNGIPPPTSNEGEPSRNP